MPPVGLGEEIGCLLSISGDDLPPSWCRGAADLVGTHKVFLGGGGGPSFFLGPRRISMTGRIAGDELRELVVDGGVVSHSLVVVQSHAVNYCFGVSLRCGPDGTVSAPIRDFYVAGRRGDGKHVVAAGVELQ